MSEDGKGWRAVLAADDDEAGESFTEEVTIFCPACAAREFDGR